MKTRKTFYDYNSYVGETVGKLKIIRVIRGGKYIKFNCKCSCGNEKDIIGTHIIKGSVKSCGCRKRNITDLSGHRFGSWSVTDQYEQRLKHKNRNDYFWLCECDCGNKSWVNTSKLIAGLSLSCGCTSNQIISQKAKKPKGEAAFNLVYYQYGAMAKKRDKCFKLTKKQFFDLSQTPCHYCGAMPSNIRINRYNNGDFIYNGIDRIDNDGGYNVDNCVPCCHWCNTMKSKYSVDEFLEHIIKILDYRNDKKEITTTC
jgi:hypothetical protein